MKAILIQKNAWIGVGLIVLQGVKICKNFVVAAGSVVTKDVPANTAESVPGPILQIGNTNSRYKFPTGARKFVNDWNCHGPAHHCAIGIGHISDKIKKLGLLLNMETIQVC